MSNNLAHYQVDGKFSTWNPVTKSKTLYAHTLLDGYSHTKLLKCIWKFVHSFDPCWCSFSVCADCRAEVTALALRSWMWPFASASEIFNWISIDSVCVCECERAPWIMCLMHAFHFACTSTNSRSSCVRRCWHLFRPLFRLNQFDFIAPLKQATDCNQHRQCFIGRFGPFALYANACRRARDDEMLFRVSSFDVVNCIGSWQMFPYIRNLMLVQFVVIHHEQILLLSFSFKCHT